MIANSLSRIYSSDVPGTVLPAMKTKLVFPSDLVPVMGASSERKKCIKIVNVYCNPPKH